MRRILFCILGASSLIFSVLSANLREAAPSSVEKVQLCSVNFHGPILDASHGVAVCPGPGVFHNKHDPKSWLMHYSGVSYVEFEFSLSEKNGRFIMNLTHLSALVGDKFYSPIKITINRKSLKEKYVPDSTNWIYDQFDVSKYLKSGKNKVKIELLPDAIGNYWINHFSIDHQNPQ